jgi:hypothetical protein
MAMPFSEAQFKSAVHESDIMTGHFRIDNVKTCDKEMEMHPGEENREKQEISKEYEDVEHHQSMRTLWAILGRR